MRAALDRQLTYSGNDIEYRFDLLTGPTRRRLRLKPVRVIGEARWQFDADRVAQPHLAAYEDDGHDSGLADEVAAFVPPQRRLTIAISFASFIAMPGSKIVQSLA